MGGYSMRALAMTVCAVVVFGSTSHADTIRVIVMAGQSNIVGGASADLLPPELKAPQEDILYQYLLHAADGLAFTEDWIDLAPRPRLDNGALKHASEITFGREVADVLSSERLAIIKVAANGSSLADANNWNPLGVSTNLYHEMLDFVELATSQLTADGFDVEYAGFVWVQGSGDAGSLSRALAYENNLNNLIAGVRSEWSNPDLPVIFNQFHVDRNIVTFVRIQATD